MILLIIREIVKGGYTHIVNTYYKRLYSFGEEIDSVKIIKLKILVSLASEFNFDEIFREISIYAE